jgi:hypothetical protein
MFSRASIILLAVVLATGHAQVAAAQDKPSQPAADVCTAERAPDILAAIPKETAQPVFRTFGMAPADGPMELVIDRPYDKNDALDGKADGIRYYRVIAQSGQSGGDVALVEGHDIFTSEISENNSLRTKKIVEQHATVLSFSVPDISAFWTTGAFSVIGCSADKKPIFLGYEPIRYSSHFFAIVAAAVTTIGLYVLVALAVSRVENPKRETRVPWYRYLDPVVMSSDSSGGGSISRLQILFFSVIVFGILFYTLIRVGYLSDMSATVLLLLGVSGVGAAASKVTDVNRNRLDFANWAWLVNRRWLPENGLMAVTVARWRDIVSADDGFDVYHFQMLVFSLVVGLALLMVGFTDLATFEVPQTLLGVLGLSQAVYVGGKLVAQPACSDLNNALTELQKREDAFTQAVIKANPQWTPKMPTDIVMAMNRAPDEYAAYDKQLELTKIMFVSVMGPLHAGANTAPRYA